MKADLEDVVDRIVDLESRAVAVLSRLEPKTSGPVFRRASGSCWHPGPRVSGAQVNRALQAVAKKAGITRHVHLHMLRHTWASWFYAVTKDIKKLREAGGWTTLDMADRYSHLVPDAMVPEILAFWGRKLKDA